MITVSYETLGKLCIVRNFANGYIHAGVPVDNKINVLSLEENAQGKRVILAELYKLANLF